jgi:hypothetical protein
VILHDCAFLNSKLWRFLTQFTSSSFASCRASWAIFNVIWCITDVNFVPQPPFQAFSIQHLILTNLFHLDFSCHVFTCTSLCSQSYVVLPVKLQENNSEPKVLCVTGVRPLLLRFIHHLLHILDLIICMWFSLE